ncbi:hypothetical protein TYRP_017031 [Tyrophagus putrescentiae]|nr:hypothetical protein TYRP_017031 [Tyrophagus putrescentiae]
MFSSKLLPEPEALNASGGKIPKKGKKFRTLRRLLKLLLSCKFLLKAALFLFLTVLLFFLFETSFSSLNSTSYSSSSSSSSSSSKEINWLWKFFSSPFASTEKQTPNYHHHQQQQQQQQQHRHHKVVKKDKPAGRLNKNNDNSNAKDDDNDEEMPQFLKQAGPGHLSEEALYQLAEKQSNIPIAFYERYQRRLLPPNKVLSSVRKFTSSQSITYCPAVQLTPILNLKHSNFYWQTVDVVVRRHRLLNGTGKIEEDELLQLHLLNAYLDERGGPKRTFVRLLGASKHLKSIAVNSSYSCLLWFEEEPAPILSRVVEVYNFRQADGAYGPVLFSCAVPELVRLPAGLVTTGGPPHPVAISLQASKPTTCATVQRSPTNILRVISNKREPTKEARTFHPTTSIGVCARALRFEPFTDENFAVRLVEWLEAVRLLGADKVYLYVYHEVDEVPSLVEVLEEYEAEGFLELHRISLPGEQMNGMQLLNELLSNETPAIRKSHEKRIFLYQQMYELHDCLYRNLHRHQYIAQFDTDELIVPQQQQQQQQQQPNSSKIKSALKWPEMLQSVEKSLPKASLDRVTHFRTHMALVHAALEVNKLSTGSAETEANLRPPQTSQLPSIPWYLYTARHIFRDRPKSALAKSFFRTDKVVAYYPYSALKCAANLPVAGTPSGGGCPYHLISERKSLLLHYQSEEASRR